jgi:hypothetical protein
VTRSVGAEKSLRMHGALVVAVALLGCSAAQGPEPKAATAAPGLELTLSVVKGTEVEVAFTNRGSKPVWFRPSFVVDNIGIRRPDGAMLTATCRTNPGIRDVPDDQPRPPHTPATEYKLLRHDESERWNIDLKTCFDLERSSDYVMSAHWEDSDATPPNTPPGAVLVKGPLDAAPVPFRLE